MEVLPGVKAFLAQAERLCAKAYAQPMRKKRGSRPPPRMRKQSTSVAAGGRKLAGQGALTTAAA
jgi:hypothetical protein